MRDILLFGSGYYGKLLLGILGKDKVAGFIDNDPQKWGTQIEGVTVYALKDLLSDIENYRVVVAVGENTENELIKQLEAVGIREYETARNLRKQIIQERINRSINNIEIYNKATSWIKKHTVNNCAIINSTVSPKPYPEVTGYYIPTLMRWGYRDMAITFAKWLCSIQKEDGSWYDTDNAAPYVFDTGQILKGLIAVRDICQSVDEHIIKGCDWVLSNIQSDGRLTTPTEDAWGDNGWCSELIHLYCLSPVREASYIFNRPEYADAADKVLNYYKENHYDDIMDFHLLSHFYAYVMEALYDLGEVEMVRQAMEKVALLQKSTGEVPAYKNVDWVCSTGLFQFALVWFKLGEIEKGNRAFSYACRLQNESGGWYGSYLSENNLEENNDYFPFGEISWAVKYFLDALSAKNVAEFESREATFLDEISFESGLYVTVEKVVRHCVNKGGGSTKKILDIGCGKGRYLNNLIKVMPENEYYAVDISEKVMQHIVDRRIYKKQGTLTCIPYPDNYFDVVYACESVEHVIDIERAICEMARVLRKGGKLVIIDKNIEKLGVIEIEEWEQWFDNESLKETMLLHFEDVEVIQNVPNFVGDKSGIFTAWIGTK